MPAAPTDPQLLEQGLLALVASGGSPTRAAQALAEQGHDITKQTLHGWKTKHATRYQELQDRFATQIEAQLVRQQRDLAVQAHEVALLAVDKTREALEADKIKDPAGTARNLEVVAGTAIDKVLLLTDRPTQITEQREPSRLIASLASKGIRVTVGETIEGTAQPQIEGNFDTGGH